MAEGARVRVGDGQGGREEHLGYRCIQGSYSNSLLLIDPLGQWVSLLCVRLSLVTWSPVTFLGFLCITFSRKTLLVLVLRKLFCNISKENIYFSTISVASRKSEINCKPNVSNTVILRQLTTHKYEKNSFNLFNP